MFDSLEKIKAGVEFDRVLDDIRDKISDIRMPIAVIQKQDLRNIVRDFDLDPCRGHANDAVSVEVWYHRVSKVEDQSQNPVLYYKHQDEQESGFSDDDIVLIIANSFQRKMLSKFGNNIICIDSTHDTTEYDFYLTTLVVVDEYGAGVPVAYCISNKKDTRTWCTFFQKLKEHLEVGVLSPKVFMSDDDKSFYNAWCEVMGPVPHRLLCTWHVDKNWREKLKERISIPEKRAAVYKALRVLLQEVDVQVFQTLLRGFLIEIMEDDDTKLFGDYFKSNYACRTETWAYCYRRNCGINTNM